MKPNNLGKLNDILFEQLDRMNNTNLRGQELQDEISRADAIIDIGRTITAFQTAPDGSRKGTCHLTKASMSGLMAARNR